MVGATASEASAPDNKSTSSRFVNHTSNQEEEDAYDFRKYRTNVKFTSVVGSIAHIVKGALGGGILGGHVAYKKAGVLVAIPLNIITGFYIAYCLHLLIMSSQILYRRTRIPLMSYSDVGEASMALFPNPKVQKYAKVFRYTIDAIICIDLFGSCACYQIIIAKSIKQLVENTHETIFEGRYGFPNLRVYLAVLIPFVILICLVRHLKYLAPFSIVANFFIVLCMMTSVFYAFKNNPSLSDLVPATEPYGILEFLGMSVFSMSCAGVVIPIENNMREPHKFPRVLIIGMSLIVIFTFIVSFSGYVAYLEKSDAPITINFPMNAWCKFLKAVIAIMIYVTHALNFWVPFDLCFYYIKSRVRESRVVTVELICRAVFVAIIGIVAIVFPTITALMGFLGCFCLSNMAFIWPNAIYLLVAYVRPGLGQYNWRLWRGLLFIFFGVIILICGSLVTAMELVSVFIQTNT